MQKEHFFSGALLSHKDDRDFKFSDIPGSATQVIPYHSDIPDIIVNQLASSQCGACALIAARREKEVIQNGTTKNLSHTYPYGSDMDCNGEGMYLRTVLKLGVEGIPYETTWESWGSKGDCRGLVRKNTTEEIKQQAKLLRGSSYYFCNTWNDVCNACRVTNGAVIIMLPVYNNWYQVKKDGILPAINGQYYGNHFVRVKDYEILEDGSFKIRCQNSYGTNWGDKGYLYIYSKQHNFIEAGAIIDNVDEVIRMFADVEEGRWSKPAIDYLASKGILSGFEDGLFKPEEVPTREQMAMAIYKAIMAIKENKI